MAYGADWARKWMAPRQQRARHGTPAARGSLQAVRRGRPSSARRAARRAADTAVQRALLKPLAKIALSAAPLRARTGPKNGHPRPASANAARNPANAARKSANGAVSRNARKSDMVYRTSRKPRRFDFPPGKSVAGKYVVERPLGGGWEGEVYVIVEKATGIRRAAKFYYPHRDPQGKAAIAYARKLDALRHCPILMQYHHQEVTQVKRKKVIVVVSELVEGRKLSEFLADQPGKRLTTFEALHVLYALARGIAPIHARGEYHGDIHDDNIMIRRQGVNFEVKLLDFFDLGKPTRAKIHKDVLNLVQVFHALVGGRDNYAAQPRVVKDVIRGLKDSLILDRFHSAGDIQRYLETVEW